MQITIIGLPYSGKTTIFNAATGGSAQVAQYSSSSRPNIGVAKVPDARLDTLTEIYRPSRTTPAEITYVDLPAAPEGLGKTRGVSGEYLNQLQNADALTIVARSFEDPSVPDGGDGVDAFRDIEVATWREDWPDKRGEWIARVREMVTTAQEDGGRALVIPARTNSRGPEREFLEGLTFALGEGFAPHPLFAEWVVSQIHDGVDALTAQDTHLVVQNRAEEE